MKFSIITINKFVWFVVLLVVLGFLFFMPDTSFAQGGLVTCSGPDCDFCKFTSMVEGTIQFVVGLLVIISVIALAFTGLQMAYMSAGGSDARQILKDRLIHIVIGFFLIIASWTLVDTLLKALVTTNTPAGLDLRNNWRTPAADLCFQQTASAGEDTPTPRSEDTPKISLDICTNDKALMDQFGGSPVGLEAPGLRDMINCYLSDSAVSALVDKGQIYTVDNSHPRCSLTNGDPACGICSHSKNSMHYGRGSGEGSKAVDFNAIDSSLSGEQKLNDAIKRTQGKCGGTPIFETKKDAIHTHISM